MKEMCVYVFMAYPEYRICLFFPDPLSKRGCKIALFSSVGLEQEVLVAWKNNLNVPYPHALRITRDNGS